VIPLPQTTEAFVLYSGREVHEKPQCLHFHHERNAAASQANELSPSSVTPHLIQRNGLKFSPGNDQALGNSIMGNTQRINVARYSKLFILVLKRQCGTELQDCGLKSKVLLSEPTTQSCDQIMDEPK
jgi:hypothetical protein